MKRFFATCLVSILFAAIPVVATAGAQPDATIEFSGNTVGVGVGFTDAKGTLRYEGKSYPVQLLGVGVAQLGVSTLTATGEVFNLKQVQDISGNYTAATAGATLSDGATEMTMQNPKGVVVKIHATNKGVDLRLSVDGVSIKVLQ